MDKDKFYEELNAFREKEFQKLYNKELYNVLSLHEFQAIVNRELISVQLWNKLNSLVDQGLPPEAHVFIAGVCNDVEYTERIAKNESDFQLMMHTDELNKNELRLRDKMDEFFTPKIQQEAVKESYSKAGKANKGKKKALWHSSIEALYNEHKDTLPEKKGYISLLTRIEDDENGEFEEDDKYFIFELISDTGEPVSEKVTVRTIANYYSEIKKSKKK